MFIRIIPLRPPIQQREHFDYLLLFLRFVTNARVPQLTETKTIILINVLLAKIEKLKNTLSLTSHR